MVCRDLQAADRGSEAFRRAGAARFSFPLHGRYPMPRQTSSTSTKRRTTHDPGGTPCRSWKPRRNEKAFEGKIPVQSYFDPPYGIKFECNFSGPRTSGIVKDASRQSHREPRTGRRFAIRGEWQFYICICGSRIRLAGTVTFRLPIVSSDEIEQQLRCLLDEVFGETIFAQRHISTHQYL